jgi:mannose-6-phosphate isomerase-like protein (cupin superfamily)
MDVRRVVTGHDADGKAVFVSDDRVAPFVPAFSPNSSFHLLWGADEPPRFPDDGRPAATSSYFPPLGGFRFNLFTLPPDGDEVPPGVDLVAAFAEMQAALPGLTDHLERDEPGMHTTATVDFEVVLSGTPVLELDDGATVTLAPGDTVVQNGTRHRWSNPGAEPAALAVILIGAHHDRVPPLDASGGGAT